MGLFDVDSEDDAQVLSSADDQVGTHAAAESSRLARAHAVAESSRLARGEDPPTHRPAEVAAIDASRPAPSSKRRRRAPLRPGQRMSPITGDAGSFRDGRILFLPRAPDPLKKDDRGGVVPIPLWPLYTVGDMEGCDAVARLGEWFVVGYRERWWTQVLLALKTDGHVLLAAVRERFNVALHDARKASAIGSKRSSSGSGSDDASDDGGAPRVSLKQRSILRVEVMGRELVMLNSCRPLVVQANEASYDFIAKCLPELASSLKKEVPLPDALAQTRLFAIPITTMPNIRGKVTWQPFEFGWRVEVQSASVVIAPYTDVNGITLKVNRALISADFQDARRDAYARAIATWNEIGGSKGHRIDAPIGTMSPH